MRLAAIKAISLDYISAPHTPYHPSYRAFYHDTLWQWITLRRNGWTFTATSEAAYASSEEMFQDMEKRHLRYFTSGQNLGPDSVLAELVPKWAYPANPGMVMNEAFRCVHDVNGHLRGQVGFETLDEEVIAYLMHKQLYSAEAIAALYGETIGQLCYYHDGNGFCEQQDCKILAVRF